MGDPFHDRNFPRGPLLGAAALISFALLAAMVGRFSAAPEPGPAGVPIERLLRFQDQPDGSVAVYEVGRDLPVDVLAPGSNGFIRGTLRALGRQRQLQGAGADGAFRLAWYPGGTLLLEDQATGERIDLGAFGPDNAAAFARLLPPGTGTTTAAGASLTLSRTGPAEPP